MKISKETKRKAITKNRGGQSAASDQQINILWQGLPDDIKNQYLKTLSEGAKDAVSVRSTKNTQNSTEQ